MFLEESISDEFVFGSSISVFYAVDSVETNNGNRYDRLIHPYSKFIFNLNFGPKTESWAYQYIVDLFHRSGGRFGGFRCKHPSHYSTNNNTGTPTYNDQACIELSSGVYQSVLWYGEEGNLSSTRRRLLKIVSGTMLVGIRDENSQPTEIEEAGRWSVDESRGQITFSTNKTDAIVGISQAAQAVIDFGASHPFVVNDSFHIASVAGMTEINGLRAKVISNTANTATVDIDTTGFSIYSGGGIVNTRPQSGEVVTCGCRFDIPVKFESDLANIIFHSRNPSDLIIQSSVDLVEVLNP